jgi:hypothetical protein
MPPVESNASPEQPEKIYLPKTSESETLKKIRHTTSHVMAMAVQKLFPKAQVTIGPWIENGFYYDFDSPEPFTEKDLKAIQKEGKGILVYMHASSQSNNSTAMDDRDYGTGAQIIRSLGIRKMNLLTLHPVKRTALSGYGIEILNYLPY